MINNLSLLVSLLCVFYVAVRASMLDRITPWYSPAPPRPAKKPRRRL